MLIKVIEKNVCFMAGNVVKIRTYSYNRYISLSQENTDFYNKISSSDKALIEQSTKRVVIFSCLS